MPVNWRFYMHRQTAPSWLCAEVSRAIVDCFRCRAQLAFDVAMEGVREGLRQRFDACRLLQRSRDARIDFQILLKRYALQRLSYRLNRSEHCNRCPQ